MTMKIQQKATDRIIEMLSKVLSNSYLLKVKAQNFHWNVVDPRFSQLHLFFEGQYDALEEAIDTLAEQIRTLGAKAPGSMREFLDLGSIDESTALLTADEMLTELLIDHEAMVGELREFIKLTQELGDEGTADIFIERLRFHEKSLWMVRSHTN